MYSFTKGPQIKTFVVYLKNPCYPFPYKLTGTLCFRFFSCLSARRTTTTTEHLHTPFVVHTHNKITKKKPKQNMSGQAAPMTGLGRGTKGLGKGGKGIGKGGMRRHKKKFSDSLDGITKPAIRRLARRAGVKRLSGLIYDETRSCLRIFLESILRDTVLYMEHSKRKTVTVMDVLYALKRNNRILYM